jgi:phosphoribosylglycinamide formyltransferase-1
MTNILRRVVVMIGGSGSNLQALIAHPHHGVHYDIVGVISHRPEAYGLQRAQKADIPTLVVDHTLFETREEFENALLEATRTFRPDWIALAGFMRVLSPLFIRAYAGRLLNIHPALLPKYKGLHTHRRVLAAGDAVHGASVHFATEDLDGGPVIAQRTVPVLPNDDETTLAARVLAVEHQLYPETLSRVIQGLLNIDQNLVTVDH